jgi:hypothetical protein
MADEKRRYPRVPAQAAAELEVKVDDPGGGKRELVPIWIRSFAPEGMGIAYAADPPSRAPAIGARVTVRCRIEGSDLELPGRVAWLPGQGGPAEPFDVGLVLNLELATFTARRTYATWIVKEISKAQGKSPGGGPPAR